MDIIEKATRIAVIAHKDQVRKDNGSPYIVHPLMVARIVQMNGFDDTVVAAAIVHDVLEDTNVTEQELKDELGDDVVSIVLAVSEDKSLPYEVRKEKYARAVATSSDAVKAVSVADKIHNAKSLIQRHSELGAEVWTKFNRGKKEKIWFERLLLTSLQETWSHQILTEYAELVEVLENLSE